jgi:hypothetical protein
MTDRTPTKAINGVRLNFGRADFLAIISMFAIGSLVYGRYLSLLGYYWDDWPVVWVYHALGPRGVATYFTGLRPVYGWIFAKFAPILGFSPIGWHVVALAFRCASSAVLYLAFCALWPRRKDIAWLVGTLVLLYPGFTLQPIAFSLFQYHMSFFFFAVSLAFTIFSFTTPDYRWLFIPISLVTEGFSYLIIEYFIGLELFRLLVIVVLKSRQYVTWDLRKFGTALISWSPYATVWMAYVVWRAFFVHTPDYYDQGGYMNVGTDISPILNSPLHAASARVLGGIHNILMSTVLAWARPFNPDLIAISSHSGIVSSTIVVAIGIYTLLRLTIRATNVRASEALDDEPGRFPRTGLLLGLAGLGVAGLPLALSNLRIDFITHPSFPDRWTLMFMLPASLTLSCFLAIVGTKRLSRALFISLVLYAFSAFQVHNASLYSQDWFEQRSLFWQMGWRAPVLKRGTSVLTDGLPLSLYGNHTAGVLNLLYNPNDSAGQLDYFIFDLSRLSTDEFAWDGTTPSYRPGAPIFGRVRSFQFHGTTAQSLVSWISPGGTMRVVSQPYENEILKGSALCFNISNLSQPGEVITDAQGLPDGPLLKMFGPEPKHEWLYFYQKAELGRQLEHWDEVASLGDEAMKQGYKPGDPSEWFPFIEGYARAHKYEKAIRLSNAVLKESPDALAGLSSLWLRVKDEDTPNSAELNGALGVLGDELLLRGGQ